MDRKKQIDDLVASMSEEEMRARAEAFELGQLKIMQVAIQALIAVSPNPDYIMLCIAKAMEDLRNATADYPGMDWAPKAIAQGATPVAEAFIEACEINLDSIKGR